MLLADFCRRAADRSGISVRLALMTWACFASLGAVRAQTDAPSSRLRDTLTQEKVDAIRDRMLVLVEKHSGRKFRKRPKMVIAKAAQVANRLSVEILDQYRFQFPRSRERDLKRQATSFAQSMALGLLGKFDFRSKVLYVTPRRFDQLVKLELLLPEDKQALLELVVAHELTHALQDESFDLVKRPYRGQAALNAWQVVIEGHATYLQNVIARELGYERAARAFDDVVLGRKLKYARAFALRYQRLNSIAFYYEGSRYFADLVAARGKGAQWQPFANPPRNASFALDKELRAKSIEAASDAAAGTGATPKALAAQEKQDDPGLLYELAPLYGKRIRSGLASTMGQETLRGLFLFADPVELSRVLRPIRRAHFLQCGRGAGQAITCAMRFVDAAAAKGFVRAANSWVRAELEGESSIAIESADELGSAAAGFDFSSNKGKVGQVLGVFRWFREGSQVIQIDATNLRLGGVKIEAIAKRAFELMRA